MSRIAAGDKGALKYFLVTRGGTIKAAAFRVLKDSALCEDVLNEVMLKIWENAAKICRLKNPDGYVYTIAYNCAVDMKRKQKGLIFEEEKIPVASRNLSADNQKIIIDDVLEKLDPLSRSVLLLKASCGCGFAEIAKMKNISYKQARRIYIKACEEFKKLYEK
jgi:RNA polymerase sigma-70 factor (ECF subfamily)